MNDVPKRKLIEVALPLEAINRESAREKSIRHGHPSTLHLWWARRPLAACRAVLFAQLVDDPSSHPDRFPTEEDQSKERRRLFDMIERLVVWENAGDETLLRQAYHEISACFDGKPPAILDPFAGGGSIPLEAQRLGLEAHASDLNPVAVLINKALIEIPPRWAGQPPVFPGAAEERLGDWPRATGLAEDVRRYGAWMRDEAEKRIGHLYPKAPLPDGTEATVIAWLWARTVTCPNPACGATMPLLSSLWLSKKPRRPTWLRPTVEGRRITFDVVVDAAGPPDPPKVGRGARFVCLACGAQADESHVKAEGAAGRMGAQLTAVVAQGDRQRVYLRAADEHVEAAAVQPPADPPDAELANDPRNIWCVQYGMRTFADLFTPRQLLAQVTLAELVGEASGRVSRDAREAGRGAEADEYANSVATYLALAASRGADLGNTIVTWSSSRDQARNLFARQAIPMSWDFVEVNPFGGAAGDIGVSVETASRALRGLVPRASATVRQADARDLTLADEVVSTDPPYYDNIGYADLADFFYVWLRLALRDVHPDLLRTVLTPKAEELIASPLRFDGSRERAETHFEDGFVRTFTRIRESHPRDVPITIFYAFKQAEDEDGGVASTGWETMLSGLRQAGLSVTATWPMRTERGARSVGIGTNVLASSIVLACRPLPEDAETTTRRALLQALKDEMPAALRHLQEGSIAPVDLAQAAIGPGMAVFTRYREVVEPDGSPMTVRTALMLINQVLDEVLTEQEGDFDADTRFAVKWFAQYGWDAADSGTADTLSRATNTSVSGLERGGVFEAKAGRARLLRPEELGQPWDPAVDDRVSVWEVGLRVAHALADRGGAEAARLLAAARERVDVDAVKELAYLLYAICEKRGWSQIGALFNGLGTSWTDLSAAARTSAATEARPAQETIDFAAGAGGEDV